jgi:hypothetical protein
MAFQMVSKNLFKHRKVRYRGLAKNTAQLYSLFALANLVIARRTLLGAVKASMGTKRGAQATLPSHSWQLLSFRSALW